MFSLNNKKELYFSQKQFLYSNKQYNELGILNRKKIDIFLFREKYNNGVEIDLNYNRNEIISSTTKEEHRFMDLHKIIKELNSLIAKDFQSFKGSYLYGSRVKGNYRNDSDIDLIMIFDKDLNYTESKKIAGFVCEIEYKNKVFIDYHPMTLKELALNPLYYDEVTNRGIYYNAA